ncbi:hypothetical protein DWF00_22760 [Bosea caraganae]|uniref:DUF4148 domain-containing protein n=1 Tax=Bosea caraganae TaxID=2763117 RepID=A0A370L1P6_9HYPH|nr:hypothetical protein [Bosea caraganae]RDJ21480.1 hypothetical protein DWE98_20825 [Bosea caraganae]RDJ23448.1 hypothetical protein DWF00_22760 [Bosea caraganae]
MGFVRKAVLAGLGLVASGVLWSGQASAQYYGRDPYSNRGDRYERRNERQDGFDRRGSFDRGDRFDRGQRQQRNPMAGMSLDDQKQAVKNHRDAQKKAIKRGYVIP